MFIDDRLLHLFYAGQMVLFHYRSGGDCGEKMYLKEGLVLYKRPPILRKCKKFRATIQTFSNLAIPSLPDRYLSVLVGRDSMFH